MSPMKRAPGHGYWRSLDQLADSPDYRRFLEAEFPAAAVEEGDGGGASRRAFLKLMGASVALAGMTACRWPEERIVPYAYRPEGLAPGRPLTFATALEVGGAAIGLLATSYDGRPVKVDGNPDHPASLGACSARIQATILGLYDPLRSRGAARREERGLINVPAAEAERHLRGLAGRAAANGGRGLAILSEPTSSPTMARLRRRLAARFPEARFVTWDPLTRDAERLGLAAACGRAVRPVLDLARADVVLALDEDLLHEHPEALRLARAWARGRRAEDGTMNRLHVVESVLSVTGMQADHRFAVPSSRIPAWTARLAAEIARQAPGAGPLAAAPLAQALRPVADADVPHADAIAAVAADLLAHRGRAVVVAGPRQPAEVHALVHAINATLGALGGPLAYVDEPAGAGGAQAAALAELAEAMRGGEVRSLVILGGNPAYDAPGDVDFAAALEAVPESVHLSEYRDETSQLCRWHLPRTHYLEAWADARAWNGLVTLTQPLIRPLWGGRTDAEVAALLAGDTDPRAHDLVRATHGLSSDAWEQALHRGFVERTEWPTVSVRTSIDAVARAAGAIAQAGAAELPELVVHPDAGVLDGRWAGNHWLQELPDPVTKLTWDNAALVSPATAERLGVRHGEVVELSAGGRTIEAPLFVQPGQAADSIALSLGYGRRFGSEEVVGKGADVNPLRRSDAPYVLAGVGVRPTGRTYELVTTQDHFALDDMGREGIEQRRDELVREATLAEYVEHPEHVTGHRHELFSMYGSHEYSGHRWGMAIDLSACIGCNACVAACQAENNIPVVGKQRVAEGREMHWIRIDRYFKGDVEEPAAATQPVACMHCEDAPCEEVCPVAATVHDSEGLNVMVYNRCVGTRYCSNNCPYKVRRFNFFNYRKHDTELTSMAYNPDVTVRSRGVMEKCTFCLQRIERARIDAKVEGRPLRDGDVVTACQQTCPTEAIVFGDLNDENSRVRRLHEHARAYSLLEFLNAKPQLKYLVRLRNPAPGLEGAAAGHRSEEHA